MECPNCNTPLSIMSEIPPEQLIFIELTSNKAECFAAKTIGETILNTQKTLKMIGKDISHPVDVFVQDISVTPFKVKITLSVISLNTRK